MKAGLSLALNDHRKARVSIFLPSLNGGGAERVMVTLANAFYDRGYAVDLVLGLAAGPYLQNVDSNVRVVNLNAERVSNSLFPLVSYLRREQPVVVLSAMTHANVIAILARLLARSRARLVISERSTISVEASRSQGLVGRILFAMVPRLYKFADKIVVVSKAAAYDLVRFSRLLPSAIDVIYNPFELEKINRKAAEEIDHDWVKLGAPPVILAIGRLSEQKDFSSLIQAFAQIRKTQQVRLLILGEGEQRAKLESLAESLGLSSDDIQMPGFVIAPFSYLARCAVFVLSSRWEGLPGVLIEAMACGAPVVSTDCPSGPNEILESGRWGALVSVGDVNALASAIARVLDTPRSQLPDVRQRAMDFEQGRAVDAYLKAMGLELYATTRNT